MGQTQSKMYYDKKQIIKTVLGHIRSEDYDEEYINIDASDLKLKILVKTNHLQFQDTIKDFREMPLEELKKIFVSIWVSIKKIKNLNEVYLVEPTWSDLMDDIALFYAARAVLFDKPVPVVRESVVRKINKESK